MVFFFALCSLSLLSLLSFLPDTRPALLPLSHAQRIALVSLFSFDSTLCFPLCWFQS